MKKYIFRATLIISLGFTLISCEEWLTAPKLGVTKLEDFFSSGKAAVQAINGAYVPLMWEFNSTYYPEWFIGDVMSDDALKGGQSKGDMSVVYDMENFKTATNNAYLLDFYRGQYQGIARANLVLEQVPGMKYDSVLTASLKNRILGEAKFLRAMYYFRLVRVFGGVPKVDFVIQSSNEWKQPRATKDQIYEFIISDLESANLLLWKKSKNLSTDLGRATKGAAQAMLLKTYLYTQQFAKAKSWGDSIINTGDYSLLANYADNFTLPGENGKESVFEIQYMDDPMSDFGQGNGFTRGSFTPILTRSRSSKAGGWGFNKPTQNLYDAYEANDPRRDVAIYNPTDADMTNPTEEIYLGSRYCNRKYALMNADDSYIALSHFSRGPINNKVIRYADVLLMYAEACCETNDLIRAKWALEEVRKRARGNTGILSTFPYGTYSDNKTDLVNAIRHERRVELAMEGHRWFDLCRWGIAKETMDAYAAGESVSAKAEMATFEKGKHELFPIPAAEIDLNPMTQNPNY